MKALFHRFACSRCGCRTPNPDCYVCREDEPERETPDEDNASLL